MKTLQAFERTYSACPPHIKLKIKCIVAISMLNAFFELLFIASVIPFLAILSNQSLSTIITEIIDRFLKLLDLDEILVGPNATVVLTLIGIGTISTFLRLKTTKAIYSTSSSVATSISKTAYLNLIYSSFQSVLSKNTSEYVTVFTADALQLQVVVQNGLQAIAGFATSVIILLFLVAYNPLFNLLIIALVAIMYLACVKKARKTLYENSIAIARINTSLATIIQETIGAIRSIILKGTQKAFADFFSKNDAQLRDAMANSQFLSVAPRIYIEYFMVLILSGSYIILLTTSKNSRAIEYLGILFISSQKIIPSVQNVFSGWSSIKSRSESVKRILSFAEARSSSEAQESQAGISKLKKFESLKLKSISYSHSGTSKAFFDKLTLEIYAGDKIAILGKSGSGKTTLLNIISSLVKPVSGKILVNEIDLYSDLAALKSWRHSISLVAQETFLICESLLTNITLESSKVTIDQNKLEKVLYVTLLSQLVSDLVGGINSVVGERGSNLSGGQKQRIGIARALYNEPSVLLLDEATSALDNSTQASILERIHEVYPKLTVISSTHRLSTLQFFSKVIEIKNKNVVHVS